MTARRRPPQHQAWDVRDPRVEQALREARIGTLHDVYASSNYVFIAELEHDGLGPGLGVYKPRRGERPLYDFPDGLYRREIAAFEFARLLGWDAVPPTVERDAEHGPGSLQLFIEHNPSEHYFALREHDDLDEQLARFAVFDLLANNADRKGGHLLLDARRHVWGIDNGLCFHDDPKLRTVIWDYAGSALPEPWLDDVRRARHALDRGEPPAEPLRALLDAGERAALVARCDALLARPVLPEMYPYRCTPWPLI